MNKITTEKIGLLKIVTVTTKNNIKVNGIFIPDFNPELQASLGATLSRDPGSAKDRLKKILSNPIIKKRIMDTYFKKYGHNSVGDMGNFIFSIEGLSMKGAFNTVENQLFNGQEASTRYLDFSTMGFLPINDKIDEYSKKSFEIYKKLKEDLITSFISNGLDKKEAEPKAFDIAGAFLPLSARTNVFWTASIRTYITQIRKLMSLDSESKEIGEAMETITEYICPNSIKKVGFDYLKEKIEKNNSILLSEYQKNNLVSYKAFDLNNFKKYHTKNNIKKLENVDALTIFGNITVTKPLDFRSARDIHRHRSFRINTVVDFSPIDLEEFYFKNIPKTIKIKLKKDLNDLIKKLKDIPNGEYAMPMATKFPYIISGDLPAWLYFLELRTGPKVHPTVISFAQEIGENIENVLDIKKVYQRGSTNYKQRSEDERKI